MVIISYIINIRYRKVIRYFEAISGITKKAIESY